VKPKPQAGSPLGTPGPKTATSTPKTAAPPAGAKPAPAKTEEPEKVDAETKSGPEAKQASAEKTPADSPKEDADDKPKPAKAIATSVRLKKPSELRKAKEATAAGSVPTIGAPAQPKPKDAESTAEKPADKPAKETPKAGPGTIRLQKAKAPGGTTKIAADEPKKDSAAPAASGPGTIRLQKAKPPGATIKISEAEAKAALGDKGPATIQIKKPTSSATTKLDAAADGSPAGTIKLKEAQAPGGTSKISVDDTEPSGGPGPATIRLKKPDGIKASPTAGASAGATSKISMDEISEARAEVEEDAAKAPRTIKVRKGGEADADEAAGAPKTLKIQRGGKPSAEPSGGGGLSVKRDGGDVSDRAARLAEQEQELLSGRKASQPGGPERAGWVCAICGIAIVVIGVVMWMFMSQLMPTDPNFKWPGKILPIDSRFYQDEPKWLG